MLDLNTTNPIELCKLGRVYECNGDYNRAVKCYFKGILAGSAEACLSMANLIKYCPRGYKFDDDTYTMTIDVAFPMYLDYGIKLGSLDCMYMKARELHYGECMIMDNQTALDLFKYLKSVNYVPYDDIDEVTLDEYIYDCSEWVKTGHGTLKSDVSLDALKEMAVVFDMAYGSNS